VIDEMLETAFTHAVSSVHQTCSIRGSHAASVTRFLARVSPSQSHTDVARRILSAFKSGCDFFEIPHAVVSFAPWACRVSHVITPELSNDGVEGRRVDAKSSSYAQRGL